VTAGPAQNDPLAAWRPSARTLLGFALLAASLLLYPWGIDAALARFGTRPVAAGLLLLALMGGALPSFARRSARLDLVSPARGTPRVLAAASSGRRIDLPRVPGFPVAFAAPPAAALLAGDVRFLHLVPAMVYLWLALLCGASLREERSLIERAARFLQPRAPDFIRSYCRKVTAVWCFVFAAIAAVIAALALASAGDARRAFSEWGLWVPIGILCVIEYVVRKAWFRYYAGGTLDRIWAALLPADRTARGRRSLEYIRSARARMRAEGFTPPGESASP
jgi:uncharacterized membrane protein